MDIFEKDFNKDFGDAPSNYSTYFQILNEGVSRLSNITKSLNHFNHQTPSFENDCDLALILNNCLIILKFELKNRVTIETELPSSIPVKGNSGQLHQVFLNIISNASHAMESKGTLSIKHSHSKNGVSIAVSDNGKGIAKESLEKIFDPFYTTKDPGKGTGLGLSIAYKIVKDHNGTIDIKSEPNNGTEVIVHLPK